MTTDDSMILCLRCLTKGVFKSGEDATVGVDFVSRILRLGSDRIKLHLWDTAGQERFRFLCQSYYRNSVGVVVAFSLLSQKVKTNKKNLMKLKFVNLILVGVPPIVVPNLN